MYGPRQSNFTQWQQQKLTCIKIIFSALTRLKGIYSLRTSHKHRLIIILYHTVMQTKLVSETIEFKPTLFLIYREINL